MVENISEDEPDKKLFDLLASTCSNRGCHGGVEGVVGSFFITQ